MKINLLGVFISLSFSLWVQIWVQILYSNVIISISSFFIMFPILNIIKLQIDRYFYKKGINNKEVVMEVVKKDGYLLKYASDNMKNDKEVVLEAVMQDINALQFASDELKNNKEFMLLIDEIEKGV